ncbi:MAG TPA: Rne/Rng family ribonuclease [Balneolales bacterium]|nr:Rne/Rng family ribonuclease [Balneolales bacterium]
MKNQIIIHAAGKQTRIALIENGELAQFFIESPENQRTVGDIYLAEVHKVMSGIRAAFIDMGTPKDAFLHFSDVGDHLEDYIKMLNGEKAIKEPKKNKSGNHHDNNNHNKLSPGVEKQMRAGEVLEPGHKLLVQIVKEPIGSKGPRVSTDITLAGRFLVLIPLGDYIGVSKRIRSYKERKRLRNIISSNLPDNFGVIVRTVADRQSEELIREDLQQLLDKWEGILSKLKTATPPALLYRDLDMTESLIRDLFAKDYNRLLIDDPKMYKAIRTYVSTVAPHMLPNIELFKGSEHIFDYMKISQDVESVFSPRVKMPSGGYLIFEQTEAMYVIDVNSGRYAAKKHQEDNSLKTNLEAAREISKQLRLRDIGGIIVVDFIDLKDDVNRKKVYDELKKEFKKDRAKTNILQMSDFGLVQITRQRIRPSVVNSVSRICPMCGGSGSVVTQNTIVSDIESWLMKFKNNTHYRAIDLYINPYLKSFLTRGFFSQRIKWMFKYGLKISMIADDTISLNDFKFTLAGSDADITDAVIFEQPITEELSDESNDAVTALEGPQKRDTSNLEVYENEKKDHNHHKHSKKQHYTKSRSSTKSEKKDTDSGKSDYYSKSKSSHNGDSGKKGKESKSDSEESTYVSTASQSRNKRSNKISKYYKGKSKNEEDKSSKKEDKSQKESSKDEKKHSDKDSENSRYYKKSDDNASSSKNHSPNTNANGKNKYDDEPRLAIEVAEEYHRKMQEKKKQAYIKKSDSKSKNVADADNRQTTKNPSNDPSPSDSSTKNINKTVDTTANGTAVTTNLLEKEDTQLENHQQMDTSAEPIHDLTPTAKNKSKEQSKRKSGSKISKKAKTNSTSKEKDQISNIGSIEAETTHHSDISAIDSNDKSSPVKNDDQSSEMIDISKNGNNRLESEVKKNHSGKSKNDTKRDHPDVDDSQNVN